MPRKTKIDNGDISDNEQESTIVEEKPVKERQRKAYRVVLVTSKRVIYEAAPGINSFTENIWGENKLKRGDEIYLDEE